MDAEIGAESGCCYSGAEFRIEPGMEHLLRPSPDLPEFLIMPQPVISCDWLRILRLSWFGEKDDPPFEILFQALTTYTLQRLKSTRYPLSAWKREGLGMKTATSLFPIRQNLWNRRSASGAFGSIMEKRTVARRDRWKRVGKGWRRVQARATPKIVKFAKNRENRRKIAEIESVLGQRAAFLAFSLIFRRYRFFMFFLCFCCCIFAFRGVTVEKYSV